MVHKDFDQGTEPKTSRTRGKPFAKGHPIRRPTKQSKPSGIAENGDERGNLECLPTGKVFMADGVSPISTLPIPEVNAPIEQPREDKIVDEIVFLKGKDKLTIRYSCRHNRSHRVQVFLNDDLEIRPVSFLGSQSATNYWKLLKQSLKS